MKKGLFLLLLTISACGHELPELPSPCPEEEDAGPRPPPNEKPCLEAPEFAASIPGAPCWWAGNCFTGFGCLRGVCAMYYGDPANPGYCEVEFVDDGAYCGVDSATDAEWVCDLNQRCCAP